MSKAGVLSYIGLGSNLGQRLGILQNAARALSLLPQTDFLRASCLYRSKAAEGAAGTGDFLNAVVELRTGLDPYSLLAHLQQIEAAAGRERPYRHAPRTLDLDILLYGHLSVMDAPRLLLPHPRVWQRDFVYLPLLELAPELASNQQLPPVGASSCQIEQENWLPSQFM